MGWGWEGDGEQGAGYQLLWAPVPRVFRKAPKEILESTCQSLVYFRTQMIRVDKFGVNYAMLPF